MSGGIGSWFSEKRDSVTDGLNLLPGNQPSYCPSMTYTQRLYGFAICLGIGILISILSCIFIFFLNFVAFGVMYTFGNLCSIGSSLFLMGPLRQIKSMCQTVRMITTIVFFVMMGLTLFAAFYVQASAIDSSCCESYLTRLIASRGCSCCCLCFCSFARWSGTR